LNLFITKLNLYMILERIFLISQYCFKKSNNTYPYTFSDYSGGGRRRNGVARCLSKEWQDRVIVTERVSDSIIAMNLVTPEKTSNKVVKRRRSNDSGTNWLRDN